MIERPAHAAAMHQGLLLAVIAFAFVGCRAEPGSLAKGQRAGARGKCEEALAGSSWTPSTPGSKVIAAALKSLGENPETPAYADLTARWKRGGVGLEAVEPVLRFMEEHPGWDFGAPGPLVHFVERFNGPEYERLLLESFERRPTAHTSWMVHRMLNGAESVAQRLRLGSALRAGMEHPCADAAARESIAELLK